MKHLFKKGDNTKPTLLLLHGTGGTEEDLLPLAERIDPEANVLSVRGNISENGLNRFFKRLAEGVFDEEDLVKQTNALHEFLEESSKKYQFDQSNIVAIGYSNGANIAGSLLFHHKQAIKGAILHHPMVPRRGITLPELNDVNVFIGAGHNDPLCTEAESKELAATLESNGAEVTLHWENQGHQLSASEVEAAKEWYKNNF
ncbi:carboxylesterase [Paraliobacillus quinghaiensis]|uniref:Carboxylesterase n=1 Tax=Paraliobacillus quinghaiensis TaxID=470815 RepID=A0A917TDX3_9BACI|nr:alpha/beta hydrolase [Paraliobacillus quinghaiensis]GGM19852.1 carboxylesterase [Paraliobacillus quinghaiensis]